ncbi:helix-turn-helix domain-containing protein [Streptococcus infantis]|uniref:helix-turn-helix domain-containing protein n=1 Tax=Streptococcus infantis TaxID=68892 RepID=UPI001CBA997C|nr:helix-turn-helix transcriptional regulator [Streptococcus infantis]MBZ2109901.1 helix-turn-helix domain-containing protein [Streptococcus infantis]MBZ2111749.1 helix-turn-helix domain-containing protein [Streptococcus infantis]
MDYEKPLTRKQCESFAFMLRQKRKDNKITLKELGNKLGYSTATISNWENLKTAPDMYNVEDVATYFNLPMNVFIGEG